MFEEIAGDYDRLNSWLSLGLDRRWRDAAARALHPLPPGPVLDLASGTGALLPPLARRTRRPLVRLDLSASLLRRVEETPPRRRPGGGPKAGDRGSPHPAPAIVGEMDRLPFCDAAFAGVAQAFALRHCRETDPFLRELYRVVRPGGTVVLLDMRVPRGGGLQALYRGYFCRILPRLAALLGGDRAAYEMMVASVRALPAEAALIEAFRQAGFVEVESRPGIFGAVRLLLGRRPE